MIALCAMLCGAEGCVDMEAFGKAKERFLKRFLTLPHGIPSHDTFSRIFRFLDPEQFGQFFQPFAPFRRGPSRGDRGRSLSFRGLGKYPARINATP